MWYGTSTPAATSKVHRLYRTRSAAELQRLEGTLQPSWAPLHEPRAKREEDRKRVLRRERSQAAALVLLNHSKGSADSTECGSNRILTPSLTRQQSLPIKGLESTIALESRQGSAASFVKPDQGKPVSFTPTSKSSEGRLRSSGSHSGSHQIDDFSPILSSAAPSRSVSKQISGTKRLRRSSVHNSLASKLISAKLAHLGNEQRFLLSETQRVNTPQRSVLGNEDKQRCLISGHERISAAFACAATDKHLATGPPLAEALLILGHPYPASEWLANIAETKCQGRQSLDEEDAHLVIGTYEARLEEHLKTLFCNAAGSSHCLNSEDLPDLLKEAGVPLMVGAAEELLAVDAMPTVDWASFLCIYQDLCSRAGLTRAEHERMREIFEVLEENGMLSKDSLVKALQWRDSLTNLAGGPDTAIKIASVALQTFERVGCVSLDMDAWLAHIPKRTVSKEASTMKGSTVPQPADVSSVMVNGSVFLAAARVFHEQIACGLFAALRKLNLITKMSDVVPKKSMIQTIEEVGHVAVLQEDVDAFLHKMGIQEQQEHMSFHEVYAFIFHYTLQDGITELMNNDVDIIFQEFDLNESGLIEAGELGPVIRSFGYRPTQYRLYDFAEEIGLTEDTKLGRGELARIIAKYRRITMQAVRKAFSGTEDKKVKVSKLFDMLCVAGYTPTLTEIESLEEMCGGREAAIDFLQFKVVELAHRRNVQRSMKINHGFTESELEKHKHRFTRGDPNQSGTITQKALREILAKLFPDTGFDKQRNVRIAQIVKECDLDGNGIFDYDEYIELMNKVTQEMDRDMLIKALRLKKELGYTADEVKQFRDLFNMCDEDMSGDIDFDELNVIFSNLIPMDLEAKAELHQLVKDVDDGDGHLDFWEFLRFMHKVQKENWRNINCC